jgi:hypothetical protein
LALLGHDPARALASAVVLDALRSRTRDQLLDFSRRLGLTGVAKLTKDVLAGRIQLTLERMLQTSAATTSRNGGAAADDDEDTRDGADGAAFPPKFDLGPDAEEKPTPQHIPWSYGQNRVTAMVVDPNKMFVYWECSDAAMEHARRDLGPAGGGAWLNLRVYDITGRLFDGTNAHSYFDHKLERWDRQWFFEINKPTSVACVELGLKSQEGYFVKICRSGRVEFPRHEPVGPSEVEWLTVHTASGDVGQPVAGTPGGGGGGGAGAGWGGGRELHGVPEWANGGGGAGPGGAPFGPHTMERRWEWREGGGAEEWHSELASIEWVSPMVRTAWEAGPFTYAVQSPAYIEEWNDGAMSVRTEGGKVHVVYGPWQVVIRGVNARAERKVLATWEIRRSWSTAAGIERTGIVKRGGGVGPGASEWMAIGASERSWMGASELRLGGASELYLLGASELLMRGASETMYQGASEWMMRGASERLMRGASEWSFAGASERMFGGASENLYAGASERLFGGASERYTYPTAGASENNGYPDSVQPSTLKGKG